MNRYDVVTLGETMLRLTPPNSERLEQSTAFDLVVGGSESNVAVGLSRLGLNVCWISRLTDNVLGRRITRTLTAHGVDTSHVIWTDEDRIGLYFLEAGSPPRRSRVLYDRAHSACSRISPDDLPAELFTPGGARLLHVSGITPALSEMAAATVRRAVELARDAGWRISFDINYRGQLWTPEAAVAECEPLASQADLLICPLRDARTLYPDADLRSPGAALVHLATRCPQATIIVTAGSNGAYARRPDDTVVHQTAFDTTRVSQLGGGDAFAAGVLYQYLAGDDGEQWLPQALRWGVAMAALKYTIPGDMPLIDREDVEAVLAQESPAATVDR